MTILGLHAGSVNDGWSSTGADYMSTSPGWIVFTEALGREPSVMFVGNYKPYTDAGYRVGVRLNLDYPPGGTIPRPEQYPEFAARCAKYVAASRGDGVVWFIGNEMNHEAEWPSGEPILADDYAVCFNWCYTAIKNAVPEAQVCIGAVAPYNGTLGDWVGYLVDILRYVDDYDGIALHSYTHGHKPHLITSDRMMDPPYGNRHYEFRAYRDFLGVIPPGVPVYITESNPGADPEHPHWDDVDNGWCVEATTEILFWNLANPEREISALCFYRFPVIDSWAMANKPHVLSDFLNALELAAMQDPPGDETMIQNPSFELPYEFNPQRDTVKVAHGWTAFWSEGNPPQEHSQGPCAPPEYKPLSRKLDPRRVAEGNTAQCWFLVNKVMDAGVYQTVPVTVGKRYKFDVSLQAWCSDSHDPRVSDEEMYCNLGIARNGGTNAFEVGVIWNGWQPLDAIHRRFESLEVEATAPQITLFVRCWNKWRMNHNDVYADDCHLIEVGGVDPPVDPPTTTCRGATPEQVRAIVREELGKLRLVQE